MLTKEMTGRLKRAGEYQKKAILELLPEGMEGHLDVIAKEVKLMAFEMMEGLAMECMQGFAAGRAQGQASSEGADPVDPKGDQRSEKVKKVSIE